GQEYELFYWSDGWQLHATVTAGAEPLVVPDLPSGGLYWLVAKGSNKEERIFTVEDGAQIFW
ncbi:MAG: transglutaminase domain-containing protein, partial [Candidatus Zixiibacteriota bacterium]